MDIQNAIKQFLKLRYQPVAEPSHKTLLLSTEQITLKIRSLYPSEEITPLLIADWLNELGFSFTDTGNMQLEWMLEEVA